MLRKAMLLGLGVLTMTKEALEKAVDELVKKGEVSQDEAKEALQELWDKGQQGREHLTKLIREQVDSALRTFTGVSREEFAALEARVDTLEAKLAAQEDPSLESADTKPEFDPDEVEKE